MKTSTLFLWVLFVATAAFGQSEEPQARPDYSRDTLMRIFAAEAEREEAEPRVRYRLGAVEFRALGTSWRFNYLPMMAPLSGSIMRTTSELPDPFALTHASIAEPPRVWRERRAMSAELRRIERLDRERAKVVVKP